MNFYFIINPLYFRILHSPFRYAFADGSEVRNEPSSFRFYAGVGGEVTRGTREERNRTEGELIPRIFVRSGVLSSLCHAVPSSLRSSRMEGDVRRLTTVTYGEARDGNDQGNRSGH